MYQLSHSSWIASTYKSHQSEIMKNTLSTLDVRTPLFIYQAPEVTSFLPHHNYYQYFSGTRTTAFGAEYLDLLRQGKDMMVITKKNLVTSEKSLFEKYRVVKEFHKYVLLEVN